MHVLAFQPKQIHIHADKSCKHVKKEEFYLQIKLGIDGKICDFKAQNYLFQTILFHERIENINELF